MVRAAISLVVAIALPVTAAAQAANVNVGDRIRVSAADHPKQAGRVTAVDSTTISIQPDGAAAPVSIARTTVKRIDISRGVRTKGQGAKRGALRWGLIAAIVGAISLGLQHDTVGENGTSAGEAAALGAFSGALVGGLIGAAAGAGRAGEKWEKIYP